MFEQAYNPAMAPIAFSTSYRLPIKIAIVQSLVMMFGLSLLLDGGRLWHIGYFSLLAFWNGVAIILIRRPHSPTKFDLHCIRWGFFSSLFIAIVVVALLGEL